MSFSQINLSIICTENNYVEVKVLSIIIKVFTSTLLHFFEFSLIVFKYARYQNVYFQHDFIDQLNIALKTK